MEQLLFLDLGKNSVSEELGGSDFAWAIQNQGDTMHLSMRMVQKVGSEMVEVERTVRRVAASIGVVDERAKAGTFALMLEGEAMIFTVDPVTDRVLAVAHGRENGTRLRLLTTDTLAGGLLTGKDFYIINKTDDDYQLAESPGGVAVDITDLGVGVHQANELTVDIGFAAGAAEMEAAINGLSNVGVGKKYGAVTVGFENATVERPMGDGSWFAVFAGQNAAVPLVAAANSLSPTSFVRVRSHEKDGIWTHEIRTVLAPVAFESSWKRVPINPPKVNTFQEGGDAGGVELNEIQKITFNPFYRGTYQARWKGRRSWLFSNDDGPTRFGEGIAPLADEDGAFVVTNPSPNVGHVEFVGSMAGDNHAELEIVEVDAPLGDVTVSMGLDKWDMAAVLRAAALDDKDEITLPFSIEVVYDDPADDTNLLTWTYLTEVTVKRDLIWEGQAVLEAIDWLRPYDWPARIPFTTDQMTVGHAGKSFLFGNVVLSSFQHNLATPFLLVQIRENMASGKQLVAGVDYTLSYTSDDLLEVTLIGGYNPAPGANTLGIIILAAGDTSALDPHEHPMGQIINLLETFAALTDRVDVLEGYVASGDIKLREPDISTFAHWVFPPMLDLFPVMGNFKKPESGLLEDVDLDAWRPGGLLPAVHDASPEDVVPLLLSGDLPDPDDVYLNRVFENTGLVDIDIFAGGGHSGDVLKAGQFGACDGNVWYRVSGRTGLSSYYPTNFNRTLFEGFVNDGQLSRGRQFFADWAYQMGVMKSESFAQWVMVVELGTAPQDTAPGSPGMNLKDVVWDVANPALEQRIILMPALSIHRFGVRVTNELVNGVGVISMDQIKYGNAVAAGTKPTSGDFAMRVYLRDFDTENSKPDPNGIVAITGPQAVPEGDSGAVSLGFASIT